MKRDAAAQLEVEITPPTTLEFQIGDPDAIAFLPNHRLLPRGAALGIPAFLRRAYLGAGCSISQADHQQRINGATIRRRGGHRGVGTVRVGVRRNDQKNDPSTAEAEYFSGVGWLQSVSV